MPFERGKVEANVEEAPVIRLTCRELDVLGLLAQGLSNRLISRRLDISEKTVKNHLSSIYLKIGATHRTQAALYAQYVGLIDSGKAAPSADSALTARERGVLGLLAQGLSNRLISRRLDISEKTVKNHLSSIYLKIGATHRTQAALYAQYVGIAT
ncbi:LuxR family transcriptional regulator [Streptomyces sp. NBRC 109706]|uniref:helix-turn-helix domain-containing protein n=1 Tax=Streptomyces sp. NBRC 109706 TaxID=1550035 RepID=UPI000781BF36